MKAKNDNQAPNEFRFAFPQSIRDFWWRINDIIAPAEARILSLLHVRGWLSYQIKLVIREFQKSSKTGIKKKRWKWKELPIFSKPLVIVLLYIAIIFGLQATIGFVFSLVNIQLPLNNDAYKFGEEVRLSAEILASLLGLLFVLAIFLFESIRGRSFEEKILPVFIKDTKTMPSLIFGLLSLVSMMVFSVLINTTWISDNAGPWLGIFNLLLFLVNIIILVVFLWNTVRLIDPNKLESLLLGRLRGSTSENTTEILKKRIWSNIVNKIPEEQIYEPLQSLLGIRKEPSLGLVQTKIKDRAQIYQIEDINLALIEIAAKRAAVHQGENPSKIRVLSQHDDRISYERPSVGLVPQVAVRPRVTEIIKQAYKLKPLETFDQFENDLAFIKDLASNAISEGKVNQTERYLSQFSEVLEEFLRTLQFYGVVFSFEIAQRDSGLFSEWAPVSKIQQHFATLLKKAIDSGNAEIIRQYTHFPFTMMGLSFRHDDHLGYQYFARTCLLMYKLGFHSNLEETLKDYVTQRGWKAAENFYGLYVQPGLASDQYDQARLTSLGNYAIYLVGVLSEVMKTSLDYGYYTDFSRARSSLREIGSWLGGRSPISFVEEGIQPAEESLENQRIYAIGEELQRIKIAKQQALFGLGGWIIHLFEGNKLEYDIFNILIGEILIEIRSIEEISLIYFSTLENETIRKIFGWDWWELKERPGMDGDPTFQPMRFDSWLLKIYAYLSLLSVPQDPDRAPKIEPRPDIGHVFKSLGEILQEFENSEKWTRLLEEMGEGAYADKKTTLLAMHQEATELQERIDEEETVVAILSESKSDHFTNELLDTWSRTAVIRNLVQRYGRYTVKAQEVPEDLEPLKWKTLEPKGVFIENSKEIFIMWGGGAGRKMARFEDHKVGGYFSSLPQAYEGVRLDDLETALMSSVQTQKEQGRSPVILFANPEVRVVARELERFVPAWMTKDQSTLHGLVGYFDEAPMVRVATLPFDEITIVALQEFGELVQYISGDPDAHHLDVIIKPIDEEKAMELSAAYPHLAKDPSTSEQLNGEDAVRWFMKRVDIVVTEWIRFENMNQDAGARIKLDLRNISED